MIRRLGERLRRDTLPKPRERRHSTGTAALPLPNYLLGLAMFVFGTGEFVITGLLPEIAVDLSVTLPRAALLISVFAVAMVICTPLLALLTINWSQRKTLLTALVLFAAGNIVGALSHSYPVLLIARFVTAAATGAFWAAASSLAVAMAGAQGKARALALLMGGLTTASVLGVPIGTAIGQRFGWETTLAMLAGAAVLVAAPLWFTVPAGRHRRRISVDYRAEAANFASWPLWSSIAVIMVFETGVMCGVSYLTPLVTTAIGLPTDMLPLALTIFGIGCLAGSQIGGRFADRYPWRTQHLALGSSVVLFTALSCCPSTPITVLTVLGLLGISIFASGAPLAARLFTRASGAPTLAGAANPTAFNLGNALGPWVGGVILSAGWDVRATSIGSAVLVAVALGLGALSRTPRSRRTSPSSPAQLWLPTQKRNSRTMEAASTQSN